MNNTQKIRNTFPHRCRLIVLVIATVVFIGGIILAATILNNSKTELDIKSVTLSAILSEGKLRCGVMSQLGFAQKDTQGIWKGFEVDLCRAVAAGIFGKDSFDDGQKEPVEFVSLEAGERFPSLKNRSVDLLLAKTSHTFERSLYEVSPT